MSATGESSDRPFGHGLVGRERTVYERDVMEQVLDDAELSLRASDFDRLHKVIFVWSQRSMHLLDGHETWAEQNIGRVNFGGDQSTKEKKSE